MDYEQKYKEALERMKSWARGEHPECFTEAQKAAEFVFPELTESEDERMRKELLDYLHTRQVVEGLTDTKVKMDWVTWLEKQKAKEDLDRMAPIYEDKESFESDIDTINPKFKVGDVMRTLQEADGNITSGLPVVVSIDDKYYHCISELIAIKDQDDYEYPPMNRMQEPTDKVEPKFKVGNFIVNNNNGTVFQVTKISDGEYCISHLYDSFEEYTSITDVDKNYHLWVIEDAKEGDVLAGRFGIFLFKGKIYGYCGLLSDDTFIMSTGDNEWTKCLHPATNVQRDLLFVKMRTSGYKWNDQKKRLEHL